MRRVKTYYDNLKVARDAPDEVIRAAYRTLTQKYHPDKMPGNANALAPVPRFMLDRTGFAPYLMPHVQPAPRTPRRSRPRTR